MSRWNGATAAERRAELAKVTAARKQDLDPPTNRWDVITYAIEDNARTVRLCVIMLAVGAPGAASAVFAALLILRLWM